MHHDTSWAWALLLGLAGCSATAAPAVLQFALCSTLGMTPAGEPGPKGAPGTNGGPSGAAPRALHNSGEDSSEFRVERITGRETDGEHDGPGSCMTCSARRATDGAHAGAVKNRADQAELATGSEFDLPNNCAQQSGCGSDDDLTSVEDPGSTGLYQGAQRDRPVELYTYQLTRRGSERPNREEECRPGSLRHDPEHGHPEHEIGAPADALPARRADDVFGVQSAPTSAHRSDHRALAEAGAPANRSAKGASFFACSTASPISRRDSFVGVHAGLICRLPNSPLHKIDFAVSRAGIDEGIDASADELSGEAGAHTANDDHSGGTPAPRSGSSTADAGWRRRRAGCSGHGRAGGRGGADGRAPPAQRA